MTGTFGNGVLHTLTHVRWLLEAGVPLDRARVAVFEDEALRVVGSAAIPEVARATGSTTSPATTSSAGRPTWHEACCAMRSGWTRSWSSSAGPMRNCSASRAISTVSSDLHCRTTGSDAQGPRGRYLGSSRCCSVLKMSGRRWYYIITLTVIAGVMGFVLFTVVTQIAPALS